MGKIPDNMTKLRLIDAIHYLDYGVKEGSIPEEYAQALMDKPWEEVVKIVEEMKDRGDDYAERSIKDAYENENC